MARIAAGDRVQRILAMVPWIVAHDGPTVSEVCARFDLAPKQLLADLEALEQVGVYPYTPGDFVTVIIEGDRIWIHYAEYFRRPLRLTPEEGLALVAAGPRRAARPGAREGRALAPRRPDLDRRGPRSRAERDARPPADRRRRAARGRHGVLRVRA